MRTSPLAVTLVSLLMSGSPVVAQTAPPSIGTAEDRAQITGIVEKWEHAWNTHDMAEELTFIGPDAAVVRFCSVLTGSEQAPNGVIRSRKFLVVTKRHGQWKVSWGQNTRLQDNVPDSGCFTTLRARIQ
jgi:hypothetical protein